MVQVYRDTQDQYQYAYAEIYKSLLIIALPVHNMTEGSLSV